MKFQTQQFDALHQLALDAISRDKTLAGIGSSPPFGDVALYVDGLTTIRFNGEGFDIYRAKALAQISVTREEALDVIMASAVYATMVHEKASPTPLPSDDHQLTAMRAAKPPPARELTRVEKAWVTRRANAARTVAARATPVRVIDPTPGSKAEVIVGLLLRERGATSNEIKAELGWPSVNVKTYARKYGITLRVTSDNNTGNSRYFGTRETEPADVS